jgi:23S rRNA (cytidine1920-2'-O)/16S rRNA (cytidine1409-2'-O)-methyltransferase
VLSHKNSTLSDKNGIIYSMTKKRLDLILHERYPNYSRKQIQSWIMQGKAKVDGVVNTKPGTMLHETVPLELDVQEPKYVSRAGFKLEKALEHFNIDVAGLVALDAGISTGGFTDCLLQHGIAKVYGVDVGYGQVHEKITHDERVTILERTNLRTLTDVGEKVDVVTLDLSFISILKVMDAVCVLLKPDGKLITLIKPQFEARKEEVERGGLITKAKVHERIIQEVRDGIESFGFKCIGIIDSPIEGGSGNKEFLGYFQRVS